MVEVDGVVHRIDGANVQAISSQRFLPEAVFLYGSLELTSSVVPPVEDDEDESDEDEKWDDETSPELDLPIEYVPAYGTLESGASGREIYLPKVIEQQVQADDAYIADTRVGDTVFFNTVEYELVAARKDGFQRFVRLEQ